ncbi:uncharacterized protein JCM15063_004156 [Sporobolomyces koalae]|uniref:uncharacterized protein n=1 Tax=Sporobolomyces koalae TaxID=500713 RepID=UPI00317D9B7B
MPTQDVQLAVNCGSSSIKFTLFNEARAVILTGQANDVQGDSPASYSYQFSPAFAQSSSESLDLSEERSKKLDANTTYEDVFQEILKDVTAREVLGEDGKQRIKLIAHRIVHGGTADGPIVIRHGDKEEKEVLDRMEQVSSFAPLHNHHAMLIVKTCLHSLPDSLSILCFDTLFHQTIPNYRRTYAISTPPHKTPVPLLKYGFHGLSYGSILRQTAKHLGKPTSEVNIAVAHLGSGGSCCLIQGGESKDTTMGVTPLEGLPGGTRSGTIDPSLIFHHTPDCSETVKWSGRDITKAEYVLNKESGFKALCGTNNFGTITSRAFPTTSEDTESVSDADLQAARLVYSLYLSHLTSYLSSYLNSILSSRAPLNHLDGIVFSGGIGEKSVKLRADVLAQFQWIEDLAGTHGGVDDSRNGEGSGVREITKDGSKVRAFVVETDEEEEMIRICQEELEKQ